MYFVFRRQPSIRKSINLQPPSKPTPLATGEMISEISTDLDQVSVKVDSSSALQAELCPAADIVFMELLQGVEVVLSTAQIHDVKSVEMHKSVCYISRRSFISMTRSVFSSATHAIEFRNKRLCISFQGKPAALLPTLNPHSEHPLRTTASWLRADDILTASLLGQRSKPDSESANNCAIATEKVSNKISSLYIIVHGSFDFILFGLHIQGD
jgi:hypothetical protein